MERIFPHTGILSGAALEAELLAPPPENRKSSRPWVSFNFVSSVDGAATVDGRSGALGNAWDQRVFMLLRQTADVLLVGAQTVRKEGYGGELLSSTAQQWRHENWLANHPTLAIVSGSLNLDPGLAVFTDAPVRPLILTLESAPQERKDALSGVADIITAGGDSLDVPKLVTELADRGFKNIHSEGGPTLLGTFTEADMVDELSLTVSPLLVGGSAGRITHGPGHGGDFAEAGAEAARTMTLTRILKADSMLFLRYVRSAT